MTPLGRGRKKKETEKEKKIHQIIAR